MKGYFVSRLDERIFQDVPDEINEDWNHGVLVGGMVSSDILIARAYKSAGDTLIQSALESREPYEVAYPIFFVYRHALELYLKLIVKPVKRNHDLKVLFEEFEQICMTQHGQQVPNWVKTRMLEFSSIDAGSFSFRYAMARDGAYSIGSELWVELEHLRQVITAICDGFERMAQEEH
jgi:hypothetical protein